MSSSLSLWRRFASLIFLATLSLAGCRTPTPTGLPAPGVQTVSPQPVTGAQPLFEDVTKSAGLDYHWSIVGKRPLTILQTIGNGCAFLDYDGDGNLDILLVGPHPALYKGDGKGHFTDVTKETGLDKLSGHFLGCAVGDYDNDGYPDIYLSAYRGGVLLHNESATGGKREEGKGNSGEAALQIASGNRVFRDVTKEAGIAPQPWGTSCTFTDFDGDGKLDLYIGNYVIYGPDTKPQLCDFHGVLSSCGPRYYKPEFGVLYHNAGNGRFVDVTGAQGLNKPNVSGKALGVAAADYDGSGHQSLAIANDEMPGNLMARQGKTFKDMGVESGTAYGSEGGVHGGMGVDWGDYDNDGKLDLCVATYQQEPKCLYHNTGQGLFVEQSARLGVGEKTTGYVAFGLKFIDYDNDGFLDLIIANGHVEDNVGDIDHGAAYREPTQLFHNVGGAKFVETSGEAGPSFAKTLVGRGLAVGDFDNDGRIDALVVDAEGTPLLLHNVAPHPGHWLLCNLVGAKSNRDGIGALLTIEAGGKKLLRRCATDGSYMSASDKRVHVGLGNATTATITIRWPSGLVTTHPNLPVDQIITLKETGSKESGTPPLARK